MHVGFGQAAFLHGITLMYTCIVICMLYWVGSKLLFIQQKTCCICLQEMSAGFNRIYLTPLVRFNHGLRNILKLRVPIILASESSKCRDHTNIETAVES